MRKVIFFLGIALVAIALLGPFFTGRMAADLVADNREVIQQSLPDWLELVDQDFERGWFTSRASQRLVITDPAMREQLRALLGADQFADQPAVLVESRITHGPVMGLIKLGLGEIDTVFLTETRNGELQPLPVALTSLIGFGGNLTMDWVAQDGNMTGPMGLVEWRNLRATHRLSTLGRNMEVVARADQVELRASEENVLAYQNPAIDWKTIVRGDQLDTTFELQASVLRDAEQFADLDLLLAIRDLPPSAVEPLARTLQQLGEGGRGIDPNTLSTDLIAVFAQPFSLEIDQAVDVASGHMDSQLVLNFADTSQVMPNRNPAVFFECVMRASSLTLDASIDATLVDYLIANVPNFEIGFVQAQGSGAIERAPEGDRFLVDVDYADSEISLHGNSTPIPPSQGC